MWEERTFVAQHPEDLDEQAIRRWAEINVAQIVRLDDRIEEVRDDSDDLSAPGAVIRFDDPLTIPYYYRIALLEESPPPLRGHPPGASEERGPGA